MGVVTIDVLVTEAVAIDVLVIGVLVMDILAMDVLVINTTIGSAAVIVLRANAAIIPIS